LARIYVEVYGCSANQADSEIIQGLLAEEGHIIVDEPISADASVILSCTVKTPTQRKVEKRIREISSLERGLVVAGCMSKAQRDLVVKIAPRASMVSPDNILMVLKAVETSLDGSRLEALEGGEPDRSCLPRIRQNPVVHIAPIATGCLGNCSYCIVKRARGDITSFSPEGIVKDAKRALEEGCREIWVTAEDTAAYYRDGLRLPELIERLCTLEGRFFIRVGMMTPNQALSLLEDLIETYRSEKIFKFLHIPIQSGNDEILGRMERRYSVEEFHHLVQRFRKEIPELSLSTDIICGFPGETDEQFADSLSLIKEIRPDVLNISRFWPRPGTKAAEMEGRLHGRATKERSRRLSKLWRSLSLESNLRWVRWEGEAIVDELGKHGGMVARNLVYKPIVLKDPIRLGEIVKIRITEARRGYLLGELAHQGVQSESSTHDKQTRLAPIRKNTGGPLSLRQ
ncbi:MAG: tRNA (N(6)-L-threonylcarbamoyladenosine(37)-C(2))-methylthiotransferase, partial [Candidatus Bathyarchaeota archaeon]